MESSTAIGIASQYDQVRQGMRRVGGEQRRGIGPDGEEGDEAQIEQAGEADLQIEAHAHQDVQPDQHQHLADIRAGDCRQQNKSEQGEPCPDHAFAPMVVRGDTRGTPAKDGAQNLADDRHDNEDRDSALRAEALPSVEEVAEFADRSLVLLQHKLDQFLEHACDQHGDRARTDRAPHNGRTDAPTGTQHTSDGATADQNADASGEALPECQHLEQVRRQRDEDRLQRHDRHHRGQHGYRHGGGGSGDEP